MFRSAASISVQRVAIPVAVAAMAVAVVGSGAAVAFGAPASADERPAPTRSVAAGGPTVESATDSDEPDLIGAIATNGREGYVKRIDLEDADGTTAAKSFTTPEQALAWQRVEGSTDHFIPVFAGDATTMIGEFRIVGGGQG